MSRLVSNTPPSPLWRYREAPNPRIAPRRTGRRCPSWILFLVGCSLFWLGCQSTDNASNKALASVIITGNTPGQIRAAAIDVFKENGYKFANSGSDRLVFEKQGGGMSNFAYGSWMTDDPVWIRVKASIVPVREMTFRLQCSAFMVRDKGGATEEEIALGPMHKHSYQKLLNQVGNRFVKYPEVK